MIKIMECGRYTLCVDCDDNKCHHAGDKVADCPRYPQLCDIRKLIDSCDECTWIDTHIDYMREKMGKWSD